MTGGVRSGKSRFAESLLADEQRVAYVAPGPAPDLDPEWAARIRAHQTRRPASWETVETTDLAGFLRGADGPVLIDCLGTWLTGIVDDLGTWDVPLGRWRHQFSAVTDDFLDAWTHSTGPVVAVTNEVGWGLVPEYRSGRIFTDLLGWLNQAVAAASDEVVLVVAGRALRL